MADVQVARTEQKGAGHFCHWLTDGRYVLESRGSGKGTGNHGPWSLWQPKEGQPTYGKIVARGSSLGQLLKWAEKNPPR